MKSPVPRTMMTKMKYVSSFAIDPALGVVGVRVFSTNGLYDPDITGVGHQPRGFDQLMALYDHYTVCGSKISVQFSPRNNSTIPQTVGVALRDNATAEVDILDYLEQGYVKSTSLSPNSGYRSIINYKCNPRRWLGYKDTRDADNLKGTASANPTEQAYWHVFTEPIEGVDAQAVYCRATIEYILLLTEPKDLISS